MEPMTDHETAETIRHFFDSPQPLFAWPTDTCGYDQHIRFVHHRNNHWAGGTADDFRKFCFDYADSIDYEQ